MTRIEEITTDSTRENSILAALIYNSRVLGGLSSALEGKGQCFQSPIAGLITSLCLHFYRKYGKAPKTKGIEALVLSWVRKHPHDARVEQLNTVLSHVVHSHEGNGNINPELTIDEARIYFDKVRLMKGVEEINHLLEADKVDEAYTVLAGINRVEAGQKAGIPFLTEEDLEPGAASVFAEKGESLIPFVGASETGLDQFFGDALQRDSLVAFLAPEGTGKTWWLIDLAWRAYHDRKRVAFFEVGDMSLAQIRKRFYIRAANRPWYACTVELPETINLVKGDKGKAADVSLSPKTFAEPFSRKDLEKVYHRAVHQIVRSDEMYFHLEVHPASTISVAGIRSALQELRRTHNGWTPDVIAIDYADLLAPLSTKMEVRDQINETWKQLRRMSMELHCLVLTATQSTRTGYDAPFLKKAHTSEDKRKSSYVTGMVGINCRDDDKDMGVMRLNWIKAREMAFREKEFCFVAGCLDVGNPSMLSVFREAKK